MRILKADDLVEAAHALQQGKTIIFPTETSYGLGCDATNQDAVDKIFAIKGRKSDKPLLVVAPTLEMAKKYLVWNEMLNILSNHWPGPLTVVGEYNGKENLVKGVVATNNTVAIRVTAHPLLKQLTEKLGRPIVATSANLAGKGEIYDIKKVTEVFSPASAVGYGEARPDIIIDGGQLPPNPPTTVVSVLNNNLQILRQGQLQIT